MPLLETSDRSPSVVRLLPIVMLAALALFAVPAEAAVTEAAGFWSGMGDGFLGLLKFLASPLIEVSIFDRTSAQTGSYLIGYYVGVMSFALVAGLTASSEESQPSLQQE